MTRHLFALLVAIDDYPDPRHQLQGCVNDIERMANYLEGRTAGERFQLHLRVLKNQAAHRQALIDGFREHLAQAGPEDVALFYFSGHGSQEPAHRRFWDYEPDRLDETLVCWDSRTEGGWDLADKELAVLLHEVAQANPHIAVFLDCCHSGSGTRGPLSQTAERRIPADDRPRPWEAFLFGQEDLPPLPGRSRGQSPSGWSALPEGRHILFAACRDNETAKEYFAQGKTWGAFSHFLLTTLESAKNPLTYRELFHRTQALVRSHTQDQYPQLEVTRSQDMDQPFLGGAIAPRTATFTVTFSRDWGWIMDAGAVHGVAPPVNGETTTLALFPQDATAQELQDLGQAVHRVQVTQVQPQLSQLRFLDDAPLDVDQMFKGVVVDLPVPSLPVALVGEAEGLALARRALATSSPEGGPSLFVQEAQEAADFRLLAQDGRYLITRCGEDYPLVAPIPGYTLANARLAVSRLEHMARWSRLADLTNPGSRIPSQGVAMSVIADGQEVQEPEVLLAYRREGGRWRQPTFAIKLVNRTGERLYCALLNLSESFAVSADFFPAGGVWLEPGQGVLTKPKYALVPRALWEQGITERRDLVKLVVSTAEFDARLMEQGKLDAPTRSTPRHRGARAPHTLNRLAQRIQSREAADQPEEETGDDWVTSQVVLTTRRPRGEAPLTPTGRGVDLGSGVRLLPHPSLRASVRLASIPESQRDLGSAITPLIFRQYPETAQPFQFVAGRGFDPGLSVLELSQVADPTVVTPDAPLRLLLDRPLEANESLLPFGFDGEFFLPLGHAVREDGRTLVTLERLPGPVSQGRRDLAGSIRILFRKIVREPLGLPFQGSRLAVVDLRPDGGLVYEDEPRTVWNRVTAARRIVLCVHGILGDTRAIARAVLELGPQDLVLAFDYENINTPIQETARTLQAQLADAGLGPGHPKELTIVAHSMGGLVSRWFIEEEGGAESVQRLIMLGTPNAGSPWSSVQEWATAALGIALNGLAQALWPAGVLTALAAGLEKVDVTLDQMRPGSQFLAALARGQDPGIPYALIAGNTSLYPALLQDQEGETSTVSRLLGRLFRRPLHHSLASLAFFRQPNDIAVSLESMRQVGRVPGPRFQEQQVGCDHMMYFDSPVGRAALAQALNEPG